MIVHTRWPIGDNREHVDPVPDGKGNYRKGKFVIPANAVAYIEQDGVPFPEPPPSKERKAATELSALTIMSALDNMGGAAKSKGDLFKAVGGNRTKFFAALQQLEESGQVRVDGRRVIVVET